MVREENTRLRFRPEWLDRRRLFWIIAVLSLLVYAQFQFWDRPAKGDRANWDYFSQVISRGGAPYRDVVNIKAPLSAYLGAAAIVATRPFGLRNLLATRIAFLLMASLTVAFTFLVAFDYLGDRRVGFLAAVIMVGFDRFGGFNSSGVEPKTPMILFGLVALWAIIKDRPFLAGIFGMLSALSWQPGLLFAGVAGLLFSRYLTRWRDLKAIRVIAGAAVPLALILVHLWAVGALADFFTWCFQYNYSVYGPRGLRTTPEALNHFYGVIVRRYPNDALYFLLALFGMLLVLLRELKTAIKGDGSASLSVATQQFRPALVIPPLVYFLFCLVNMGAGADLIPMLPFTAILAAVTLICLLDQAVRILKGGNWLRLGGILERRGVVTMCLLVFLANEAQRFPFRRPHPNLRDQDVAVAEIRSYLQPGDKIFVHGDAEILAVSGLSNASQHYFLGQGRDNYLDVVEPGGFNGWLERLKATRPKVLALYEIDKVDHGWQLEEWAQSDYEEHRGQVFKYWVRKELDQK